MAKQIPDAIIDLMLEVVADNADKLHVCSTQPANYAGIAALEIASGALTTGDGNGDYTIANGDSSGRKLTIAAQTGMTATATATAGHIVLSDGSAVMHLVTTCASQSVTSGNTVNTAAFDWEIADAS